MASTKNIIRTGRLLNPIVQRELLGSNDEFYQIVEMIRGLRVRFIGVRDQFSDKRLEWIYSIFHSVEVFDFGSQETFALSVAEREYDILIVGGNDASRIAKFARANAPALTPRVMFAIMDQADPPRRARLLYAGFDDVFDLSRTVPQEATVRIAAVWRRYKLAEQAKRAHYEQQAMISAVSDGSELGRREALLLEALCKKINRPVSCHSLINICSPEYELISFDHLKVLISNLRKKLNKSYKITYQISHAYTLSRDEHDQIQDDG